MFDLLKGHIQKRRVTCGKVACRCAKGSKHTAHYHIWHQDGRRYQKFVRRGKVEDYFKACNSNRALQSKLRSGRAEYRQILAHMRELLRAL